MVLCFEERVFILSTVDKAGAGEPKEAGGRVLSRAARKQSGDRGGGWPPSPANGGISELPGAV